MTDANCPFYTVYTLDSRTYFTYDDPRGWKEELEGWDKWWVIFRDLEGRIIKLNPDLITAIIWKDKVIPRLKEVQHK